MFNDLKNELHKNQEVVLERAQFRDIVNESFTDELEGFVLGENGALAMSSDEDDTSNTFKSDSDIENWANSFDKQLDDIDEEGEENDVLDDPEVDDEMIDDDGIYDI